MKNLIIYFLQKFLAYLPGMNLKNLIIGFGALAYTSCVWLSGYSMAKTNCSVSLEKIKSQALANQVEAQKKQHEAENQYREKLEVINDGLFSSNKNIEQSFTNLTNTSLFGDTTRMSDNTVRASDSRDVPQASKVAGTLSEGECKCSEINRAKLQRLYQKQLEVARDCDITANYYNSLLDYLQSVK